MKAIRIRFFDNDYRSPAIAALNALAVVMDLCTVDPIRILVEFKFLIHYLSNVDPSRDHKVCATYFDKCAIETLDFVPSSWDNSETVVYNCEEGNVFII